jgi:hypothetical protein
MSMHRLSMLTGPQPLAGVRHCAFGTGIFTSRAYTPSSRVQSPVASIPSANHGVYLPTSPPVPGHEPSKLPCVWMFVPSANRKVAQLSLEQRPKACKLDGVCWIQCITSIAAHYTLAKDGRFPTQSTVTIITSQSCGSTYSDTDKHQHTIDTPAR